MKNLITSILLSLVFTLGAVLLDASETSDLFNSRLGEMSSDNQDTRKVAQQDWMRHCLENSAKPNIRAEAQDLMTQQINTDLPVESAVWLIRVLGWIGDAQAVPVLEKRLVDKEIRIADEAARALANIPAEEAAKALERTGSPLAQAALKERRIDRDQLKKAGNETVMPLALPYATDQAVADWMKYYGGLSNVDKARTLVNLTKRRDAKYVSLAIAGSKSEDEFLRNAAIAAIGGLGSGQHFPLMLDLIFQDATREQAKTAMVRMRGRSIDTSLANALRPESTPDRFELIADVMTQRFDPMAKMLIFGPVLEKDWPNRITLLQFAEELASKDDIGDFVAGWERINDASQKDRAEQIIARLVDGDSSAVLKYRTENNHAAMFSLLGRIGDKNSLDEIRCRVFDKPLKDGMTASAPLKAAAFRALCNWPDARVADDLYTVASNGQLSESERISALRAFIRVISLPRDRLRSGLDEKGQVAKLASAMDLATRKEEKELVLQRVGQVRSVASLTFAMKYCDEEGLRPTAFGAVVDLAHHTDLRNSDKDAFAAALDKVLAESKESKQRERAKQYRDAIK